MSSNRRRRLTDRKVGSNTTNEFYSLTIEALDKLVGSDVTQQKLESLEFNEKCFRLLSLDGIDFVGVANPTLRAAVTTISLQENQLVTLAELVHPLTNRPLFPNLSHVFAPSNFIQFLCCTQKDMLRNAWPATLHNLVELDLSDNFLDSIPDCTNMPKIRRLRLSKNRIRPPWKQLKLARELEELDLSDNLLDWTEAEFLLEVKVLRELRVLRSLKLAHNPFCQTMPDYVLFCLKELATAQVLFLGAGSKTKYFINNIDGNECNDAMHDRAMSIKQPDRKRREFLAKVGYRGNIRLIDSNKEKRYLKSVVRKKPNGEEKTEYDDDDGENFEDEKELATGLASKADTEASLYKLIMLADLCAQNPSAATPAISMMLKCVFFFFSFSSFFSVVLHFFGGKHHKILELLSIFCSQHYD